MGICNDELRFSKKIACLSHQDTHPLLKSPVRNCRLSVTIDKTPVSDDNRKGMRMSVQDSGPNTQNAGMKGKGNVSSPTRRKFTLAERSWITYDWANSVYATIIMAAVFPIYFANVTKAAGVSGDVLWGYGTSFATFVIAISAPFLGAIGDFKGMKKRLFVAFLLLALIFTTSMALTDNYRMMLAGYILSYIGFAGSLLFYDSFLTDVTEPDHMDRVSAHGYAMGYLGGSTIPFLVSIALILFGSKIGINGTMAVKISCVMASAWWAVFSIPMLKNVKQRHYVALPPSALVKNAWSNLVRTAMDIFQNKAIFVFALAYFFYIDGVNTVIHMATAYGSTLGLGSTGMILALLVTQIVAVPCSILFGKLAERAGSIRMITIAIAVYFVICTVGFYMGFSMEPAQNTYTRQFSQQLIQASDALKDATIGDAARDEFNTQMNSLMLSGKGILSSSNRVSDFQALVDEQIAQLQTRYPAESDRTVLKAGLTEIGRKMSVFLSDATASGAYDQALKRSSLLFWILAFMVGTVQGGIQALSRSFFGKLVPPEKSNEYFGFFDIFGKFAAVLGPALYSSISALTGRPSIGILSLMILFAAGLLIMFFGRRHLAVAEAHGRRAADASRERNARS